MVAKQKYHPSWKVAVWIVGPLLFSLGGLGHFITTSREESALNAVFIIASCAVGWAAGMILSPDSTVEERKFTSLWKGITLFVSGYPWAPPLNGGLLVLELPSREAAVAWAARIAKACRCDQELRVFGFDPAS